MPLANHTCSYGTVVRSRSLTAPARLAKLSEGLLSAGEAAYNQNGEQEASEFIDLTETSRREQPYWNYQKCVGS
jgi:hypothetical protein